MLRQTSPSNVVFTHTDVTNEVDKALETKDIAQVVKNLKTNKPKN